MVGLRGDIMESSLGWDQIILHGSMVTYIFVSGKQHHTALIRGTGNNKKNTISLVYFVSPRANGVAQ